LLGAEAKDADFLVPAIDIAGLRAALTPHGRTEELVVAGRPVGVRHFPTDRELRKRVPAGIELAPPRREVSTGPGRHDFEIVVDPTATVEEDLERRDFTVNAMARRLDDGTLVDPFDGRGDLTRKQLRTVSPRSFAEDPLRLVRGLRFVSQLAFDLEPETLQQMRENAESVQLVSGERIGGGLAADGLGELSKLLLGAHPSRALAVARDTGVLVALIPEFGPAFTHDPESPDHAMSTGNHILAVVQAAADIGAPLRVRLATLFHDLGKPSGAPDHAAAGAEIADEALQRFRYPTDVRRRVVELVRIHPFHLEPAQTLGPLDARRLLAAYGEGLVLDLLDHWEADVRGRDVTPRSTAKLEELARFRPIVQAELGSPHRLSDLAIDGTDLIELGVEPGPQLGKILDMLLRDVVENPSLNTRDVLIARATELLT
jgi:tRNA nucleotidyltransferase (CCA-adding enzyme)